MKKNVDDILNSYVNLISMTDNYIKLRQELLSDLLDIDNNKDVYLNYDNKEIYLKYDNSILLSKDSWLKILNNVSKAIDLDFSLENFKSIIHNCSYTSEYSYNKKIPLELIFKCILRINPLDEDEISYFNNEPCNSNGKIQFIGENLIVSGFSDRFDDYIYSTLIIKKDLINLMLNNKSDLVTSFLNEYYLNFISVLLLEIHKELIELSMIEKTNEIELVNNDLDLLVTLINKYPKASKKIFDKFFNE